MRKRNDTLITSHLKTGIEAMSEASFIEMSLTVLQKPDTHMNTWV
jgi:hypothetical protein